MANEPIITITGNLTRDPELRTTQAGISVAGFDVAATPRNFNKQTQQWEDGETLFVSCSAWRELGENVANTLSKGMRVIVTGRLGQRSYEHNGEKRTSLDLMVEEVGPSLRYATAQVVKTPKSSQYGGQDTRGGQFGTPGGQAGANAAYSDPWATGAQQPSYDDKPPF